MIFIKPYIKIQGDSEREIMRRSGELVGVSRARAIWRVGFLKESDSAKAYGVCTQDFTWVLALPCGKILDTFQGFSVELPERYNKIIRKEL